MDVFQSLGFLRFVAVTVEAQLGIARTNRVAGRGGVGVVAGEALHGSDRTVHMLEGKQVALVTRHAGGLGDVAFLQLSGGVVNL